ncbi:MAG: thiamine-phosphate kinase [Candidatus Omnitrophica bacterium]|nr:thiamine-phosphate kinase [Candidatus Omnitrophota bacterium]MCM8828094.1 thiamine-phosphate kinase [Candidatus Omnitrophota bacterium]
MDERQIIKWLKSRCRCKNRQVKLGIGDDTAVIDYNRNSYLLLTTDVVVENVHFKMQEATFRQIGRKALAVNISDIAAMGGNPLWALVSLGMEKKKADNYREIYTGILEIAEMFNIDIVGGNLSRSETLFVDIFLIGIVEKKKLILRNTARPGDIIFVTGTLGGAQKGKQFRFIPRVREAKEIIKSIKPSAMIDLSDGLASDARKLAEASGCGFEIETSKIPVSRDASEKNRISSALYDGEDYELLFTVSPEFVSLVPADIKGLPVTNIGRITRQKTFLLKYPDGKKAKIRGEKFKHFS